MKKQPYRVAPPRPLEEDEIKPLKKPLSNRVKGVLYIIAAVGTAYTFAFAKDQGWIGPKMSAVADLTAFLGFLMMIMLGGGALVTFFGPKR